MDRISTATTSTTAWWGFCFECRLHFGNHLLGCSHLPPVRVDLAGVTLKPIAWLPDAAGPTAQPTWRLPNTTGANP